jgi:hypothetical protein
MSRIETIIKLEKERDVFPKGTGPYQKYQNAINGLNKMKKYYRVFDHQRGTYFATGYNATSMEELIEDFRSYMQEEDDENNQTWPEIADSLQDVTLEESETKFEEEY